MCHFYQPPGAWFLLLPHMTAGVDAKARRTIMSIFLLKVFKRLARIGLPALLILTLFLTSSCALLLLGAGGLGDRKSVV